MGLLDRLTTIVITVTVTSAAWIVAGGTLGGVMPRFDAATDSSAASQAESSAAMGPLLIPVAGAAEADLRDTFGESRATGARVHAAIDIMAPRGTPVIAAAPGTLEKLFLSKAGGNTVYLRSEDRGTIQYYAHLDRYEPGLKEGQRIAQGQRLGTVGSTGNANPNAPHLHFAILRTTPDADWWEPATAINPYPLLTGR